MLQHNPQLKSLIDKLWNSFWSGGISNPLTAIEQITYLLFMKRLDDLEAKRERDAEFTGEKYNSRFSGSYTPPGSNEAVNKQSLRWSNFKQIPQAEQMLTEVQSKVFPFLKQLNGGVSPFTHSMKDAVFIIPKPSLLVEAIGIIEQIFRVIEKDAEDSGHSFQDIQGDVYEMLLNEIASAGKNGQFRTPRHIIKLMAELVKPQLGQRIGDPACGTGGFLLGAYQYILSELVRSKDASKLVRDEDGFERGSLSAVLTQEVQQMLQESLYGFDIDVTMVRLGLMNLMMHGIDQPRISYMDTLSKGYNEDNLYDVVMANPPFTGNIDAGDKNPSLEVNTNKTELLFLFRIYLMLRMGGTAAVIVPQGVLFGSAKAFVATRTMLVELCELKAVIALPAGVFKPYAGVATAILLFTKGGETENVWFYGMENDGYSLDDKRSKIEKSDVQDILQHYHNRTNEDTNDRKQKFFAVPKKVIVENDYDLSVNKYREEVYEERMYDNPKDIISKLDAIEDNIKNGLSEIKGMI